MAKRNVVDFKIINLSEEKFQELKEAGQIDPNALYTTPDTTKERLDALETTKQDKATVVNYDNITNCITHIPQDIKLELFNDNGQQKLKIKAGSKFTIPNGVGVFSTYILQTDFVWGSTENRTWCLCWDTQNNVVFANYDENNYSGTSIPSVLYGFFYHTDTNYIYDYRGNVRNVQCSFPITRIKTGSGGVEHIEQVFNGFGYIGSTKYVLPGVKGLIPNDRNADGSLNNKEFTVSNVLLKTGASTDSVIGYFNDTTAENYNASSIIYNKELNRNINTVTGDAVDMIPYTNIYHQTAGKIDYCTFKKPFHAVDYSNTEFIANQAMPSSKYVDFTLGASGTQYTAPADGYMCCVISTTINGHLSMYSNYWQNGSAYGAYVGGWVPVRKGVAINVFYEGLIQVIEFRFRYAVGAK